MDTIIFYGILSAYCLWPTLGTMTYRQDAGQLPQDVSEYHAMVAVDDCSLIGHDAVIHYEDQEFTAIVFDCTGVDGTQFFSDGDDMSTPYKLAGEVDWHFWQRHPEIVRSLVTIEVER